MRVYHFINTQYGLQVLLERRLKIARVHELNDPFEFMGIDVSEDTLREAMESVKDQYNETWGILCFSNRWDSPVQWAHYADGHRGLCLGFDIPDEHLTKVTYVDKRLSAGEFHARTDNLIDELGDEMYGYISQAESTKEARMRYMEFRDKVAPERLREDTKSDEQGLALMEKTLSTKFSHWRYENEYRLFISLDGEEPDDLYYFGFSEDLCLREVLIGVRSELTPAQIKTSLGDMAGSVSVSTVRAANREFVMEIDERDDPQVSTP